jgi:SAM-dependent methyltransferase
LNAHDTLIVASERQRLPDHLIAATLRLDPAAAGRYAHPTPIEPEVIDYVLDTYTHPGDSVLDPLCGTGTVVRHALERHRNAFGGDVVEEYVRLANASIRAATGLDGRVKLQSALHASEDAWSPGVLPFRLCFFSPPLLRVDRGPYPDSVDQLGNYGPAEQGRWLDDIARIAWRVAALLRPGGFLALMWRNQKFDGGILPNVNRGVARLLDLDAGFRLIDEKVVLFSNQTSRYPEVVHVFRRN